MRRTITVGRRRTPSLKVGRRFPRRSTIKVLSPSYREEKTNLKTLR